MASKTAICWIIFLCPFFVHAQIYTSEVEVRSDANGNVGIGTNTPYGSLHIANQGSAFISSDDRNDAKLTLSAKVGNGIIENNRGGAGLQFNTVGTQRMVIDAIGNVGIGTSSPQSVLQISSSDQYIEKLRLSGMEYYTNVYNSPEGISFLLGVNRSGNRQLWIGDSEKIAANTTNAVLRFQLGSTTPAIDALSTDGTTYKSLAIHPGGGNVGFGTLAPNSGLHYRNPNGNASLIVQAKQHGSGGIYSQIVLSNEYSTANTQSGGDAGRKAYIRATSSWGWGENVRIGFFTSNSKYNVPTERMVVAPDGNVGIGTTSPSQRLHVNGNVLADNHPVSSDRRLKENFESLSSAGFDKIKTYKYQLKKDGSTHYGVVAQDIREIYPTMVLEDQEGFLSVSYDEFIPLLIRKVQEQDDEITKYQKEVNELKSSLRKLELIVHQLASASSDDPITKSNKSHEKTDQ